MPELPHLSMVIGGAASGKSDFAERLVINAGGSRIYLATAQAFDDEMAARIERHKATRADDGWTTVEEPRNLSPLLAKFTAEDMLLIDCATLWLTNLVMNEANVTSATEALMKGLHTASCRVVIVTNETGQGIVPDNRMARTFRQQQGQLNQKLAAQAELVVQVVAGLPQILKGELPGSKT